MRYFAPARIYNCGQTIVELMPVDPSSDGWIGTEEVARRYKKLQQSASGIETHCAIELCKLDGADPHKKVRGVSLWMHYLGTVRNVLTITRLAREFEAIGGRS